MKTYINILATISCVIPLFFLSGCTDDNNPEIPTIDTMVQWGKTLRGDGEELGAYPDLYCNYWEYTFSMEEYPDVALRIEGRFPYARYFSFSIYNDDTGSAIGGINDYEIMPDEGSDNPFVITSDKENRFTIYIVPSTMDEAKIAALPSKNICRVDQGVRKLAVCIRHYLGTDAEGNKHEYGGVEMPAIYGVDIKSLKDVAAPPRAQSNIEKVTGQVFSLKSDETRDVPFFLAPKGRYYPNNSTSYLYARTHLQKDSVLVFSFIPVPIPERVEDYDGAKARYWSFCLGAASNTRSYYSIHDRIADAENGEKANFIIALEQNSRLPEIKARVESLKLVGEHWNIFVWDSEKIDVDGKPLGDVIALMYRNILADDSWEYSIAGMVPTNYYDAEGEPIDKVTNPNKQLAHLALGDYGPYGMKYSTEEFLLKTNL